MAAQLHLFFAAFVLGAPIFIVICEYLGARRGSRNWRVRLPLGGTLAALALAAIILAETSTDRVVTLLGTGLLVGVILFIRSTGDARYERLARETMKVVTIAYSITALSGAAFGFVLMGFYGTAMSHLFEQFGPVFGLYIFLFFVETILLYLYWYSWGPLAQRKALHISIGVALNGVGTVVMLLMNAVGAYMLTPPEAAESAGLWSLVNNAT